MGFPNTSPRNLPGQEINNSCLTDVCGLLLNGEELPGGFIILLLHSLPIR